LPDSGASIFCLDSDWPQAAQHATHNLDMDVDAGQLAYMIYTSGSTGNPKGSLIDHRAVVNRLNGMQDEYGLTTTDRVLQKTPFTFDVSVWEFFWTLLRGATLVMARPEGHKDPLYLIDLIKQQQISTLHFVPSVLQFVLAASDFSECTSLQRLFTGGESLTHEVQQRFFSQHATAELHHLYGPTEATIDATYWRCRRGGQQESVPIGFPVGNMQVYVLDSSLQPVPLGVVGELYIGGVQLARGYRNRFPLTAETFIPNPFSRNSGHRLYRTGDLGRYRADGAVQFVGRRDNQVKVRGFRVELGEVEAALSRHPDVAESTVSLRRDPRGDPSLTAYVVPIQQPAPSANALRTFISATLPDYMLPNYFIVLERIPLTPHGKVDDRALPEPDPFRPDVGRDYVEPRNETERTVAQILEDVLHIDQVGAHDDFFDLGGHSLLATRVISRLRDTFGTEIPLRQIFETPTVSAVAESIDAMRWAAQSMPAAEHDHALETGEL
jgi:amino acid adenylation domain-containing protein